MRKRLEQIKCRASSIPSHAAARAARCDSEEDERKSATEDRTARNRVSGLGGEEGAGEAAPSPPLPGSDQLRLPLSNCFRMAERSERIDDGRPHGLPRPIDEMPGVRYRRSHHGRLNPGPVVTTYEFKPEAGINTADTGLAEDLCLA